MSDSNDLLAELSFTDLERVKIPVSIGGEKYWMLEASVDDANKFLGEMSKQLRFGPDGKPFSIGNPSIAESYLLSKCLFTAKDNGTKHGELRLNKDGDPDTNYLVPQAKILKWPSKVFKPIIARLRIVSDLNEKEDDTEEGITKRISDLQNTLDRIKAAKSSGEDTSPETPAKNGQSATQVSSQ
jgi:hypothetical protein